MDQRLRYREIPPFFTTEFESRARVTLQLTDKCTSGDFFGAAHTAAYSSIADSYRKIKTARNLGTRKGTGHAGYVRATMQEELYNTRAALCDTWAAVRSSQAFHSIALVVSLVAIHGCSKGFTTFQVY